MGSLVEKAFYSLFGTIWLAFLVLPAAILFLGYLIYILVMTIREWRK